MKKDLYLLGSTGSIGNSTLKLTNMSLIWQKISLKDVKKGGNLPPFFSFDSF